jgi:hypothetical protein
MEMARAVAPIMAADWYLMRTPNDASSFIINDRGYGRTFQEDEARVRREGLLAPMTSALCLVVLPTPERVFAVHDDNAGWLTSLPSTVRTAKDVDGVNAAIAHDAVQWIAARTADEVEGASFGQVDLDTPTLAFSWPKRGRLGTHDKDWSVAMRLAGFEVGPDDWQPLIIASSTEPGVRLSKSAAGPLLRSASPNRRMTDWSQFHRSHRGCGSCG